MTNMIRGRRTKSLSGFSLLEMMVAMVILSMSLVVLYQATAGATRNARVSTAYTEALVVARSLLEEAKLVQDVGSQQGTAGQGGKYQWEVWTQLLSADDRPEAEQFRLATVKITVSWQDGDSSREVQLNSIVPVRSVDG